MRRFLIIIFCMIWALAITSSIYNIRYEEETEQLRTEIIELRKQITEKDKIINEKDELIKEYQYGISQIEFFDECYIGDCDE